MHHLTLLPAKIYFVLENHYQEMEGTCRHIMVDSQKQSDIPAWNFNTELWWLHFSHQFSFLVDIVLLIFLLFTFASLKVLIKYCSWFFFTIKCQLFSWNTLWLHLKWNYQKMKVFRWCKIWLNKESLLPVTAVWHPWSLQVLHLVRVKTH